MPRYTMRLLRSSEGMSGGGPMRAPSIMPPPELAPDSSAVGVGARTACRSSTDGALGVVVKAAAAAIQANIPSRHVTDLMEQTFR